MASPSCLLKASHRYVISNRKSEFVSKSYTAVLCRSGPDIPGRSRKICKRRRSELSGSRQLSSREPHRHESVKAKIPHLSGSGRLHGSITDNLTFGGGADRRRVESQRRRSFPAAVTSTEASAEPTWSDPDSQVDETRAAPNYKTSLQSKICVLQHRQRCEVRGMGGGHGRGRPRRGQTGGGPR